MSRIFGESSKDKVSIIAANFFGIPEALASWVRQRGGLNMWFKYLITFLDIFLACMIALSFKKDKAVIIGFTVMIVAYAASAFLIWN